MSTPAQSKIEFAAHLIKISSQIGGVICGPFRDKRLIQYFSFADCFCIATYLSSVGYTIDVNDSFLLFVEMSSDVFA